MKRVIGIILFVVLVGYLLTGLTTVRPGERAVVRRFGRVLPNKPEPGLYVGLPWGMDRVDRVPVDLVRRVEVGYRPDVDSDTVTPVGQLLTGDHNLIDIQVVLHYSILEDQVEDYVVQADRVDGLIARLAESVVAEWVAGRTVDDVILNAKSALPGWIVRQTRERIKPYRLGVQLRDEASVAYLYPPKDVRAAFDRVTEAQTRISTMRNEAEQRAQQTIREAESERFKTEQLAKAYAREQRLLAEADAVSFDKRRQQYHLLRRDNPAFLNGLWWEQIGMILGQLRDKGRIDLLDNYIGSDGVDVMQFPPMPKKK
jgi:membrane protease subunit HflK